MAISGMLLGGVVVLIRELKENLLKDFSNKDKSDQ